MLSDTVTHGDRRRQALGAMSGRDGGPPKAEQMRKFRVLSSDLTEANDYLTPTLKVRRSRVVEDFAEEIDALYRS